MFNKNIIFKIYEPYKHDNKINSNEDLFNFSVIDRRNYFYFYKAIDDKRKKNSDERDEMKDVKI